MKVHELEQLLRKGHYLIAALGSVYLWKGVDRVAEVPLRAFHRLIKDGVLRGEDIENGRAKYTKYTLNDYLSAGDKRTYWQQRAEKAEKERDELCLEIYMSHHVSEKLPPAMARAWKRGQKLREEMKR